MIILEKEQPDFVIITKRIWNFKELTIEEKLLFCKISFNNNALISNSKTIDCDHLMDFFNFNKEKCIEILQSLKEKGFLNKRVKL